MPEVLAALRAGVNGGRVPLEEPLEEPLEGGATKEGAVATAAVVCTAVPPFKAQAMAKAARSTSEDPSCFLHPFAGRCAVCNKLCTFRCNRCHCV